MTNDSIQRSDFKTVITPHLELLLQYSLWLTKNGLDATRLMREALVETSRLFNESPPERHWDMRVQEVLTRRFLTGEQAQANTPACNSTDNVDDIIVGNYLLFLEASDPDQNQLWLTTGPNSDESYLNAIASLPSVCRSAMILSYLEGFTADEIAELVSIQPQAVESLLSRGRHFIQEELYAYLIGDDGSDLIVEREVESA
jgi:DNA-directed RNA polymerase specialized sigma24 family protein